MFLQIRPYRPGCSDEEESIVDIASVAALVGLADQSPVEDEAVLGLTPTTITSERTTFAWTRSARASVVTG